MKSIWSSTRYMFSKVWKRKVFTEDDTLEENLGNGILQEQTPSPLEMNLTTVKSQLTKNKSSEESTTKINVLEAERSEQPVEMKKVRNPLPRHLVLQSGYSQFETNFDNNFNGHFTQNLKIASVPYATGTAPPKPIRISLVRPKNVPYSLSHKSYLEDFNAVGKTPFQTEYDESQISRMEKESGSSENNELFNHFSTIREDFKINELSAIGKFSCETRAETPVPKINWKFGDPTGGIYISESNSTNTERIKRLETFREDMINFIQISLDAPSSDLENLMDEISQTADFIDQEVEDEIEITQVGISKNTEQKRRCCFIQ